MFSEDLYAFFDTVNGFAIPATWKRADGDVVENVLFDEETDEVFADESTANLRQITYPSAGSFSALGDGDLVEINGVRYRTRPPRLKDDGALMTAVLVVP
ncbi:MAG: hypothetical protein LBI35_06440 [Burkholderiales bacterium]|jgi:hypothetical protein|nr:hypothetical protein [Burkholderiales bacterium]